MGEIALRGVLVLIVTALVVSGGVPAGAGSNQAGTGPAAQDGPGPADVPAVDGGGASRASVVAGTAPATRSGAESAMERDGASTATAGGAAGAATVESSGPATAQADEEENRSLMTYGEAGGEPVDDFERRVEKEHPVVIPFKTGAVRLEEGLDPAVLDTDREYVYVVVQFRGEPSAALLEEYGYRQVEPLTYLASYARLPRETVESFAAQEVVRSVAAVEPAWKLSPALPSEGVRPTTVLVFEPFDALEEYGLERVGERRYRGELSMEAARSLARRHEVKWIQPYTEPGLGVAQGRRMVNAEDVSLTYSGSGVRVGVIDTGIAHGHPHFSSVTVVDSYDVRDDDWFPEADNWNFSGNDHGVHVAGTIAGQSTGRGTEVTGVAPQATLVPARGLTTQNFDRVAGNGSDIISNSWGANATGMYQSRSRTTDQWARNNRNVLLVFCYGNVGDMGPDVWEPGLAKNVLTVGAVSDGSTGRNTEPPSVKSGNEVSRLNDKNQPKDGRTKPDVLGPGEDIFAPSTNGTYAKKGGCSMATPHVSGVAGLVEDAYASRGTDLRANQLKALLAATTGPVDNPNNLPKGHGIVDAENAVYENRYESVQQPFGDSVRTDQTVEHGFFVNPGSEEVVVSLSWIDPAASTGTNDTLVNDLDMYVGPEDDPKRYSLTDDTENLLKRSVEDPESGRWVVTVDGYEVPDGPQRYDGVVRVVNREPEFFVHNRGTVEVGYWEGGNATVNVTLIGLGAPVTGTWMTVKARSTSLRRRCGNQAMLAGTVSRGEREESMHCFEVPYGTANYTVDVTAGGTNAVGGQRSETIRLAVVTDTVAPNSSRPQGYVPGFTVGTLRIEANDSIQAPGYDPSGVADVRWRLADPSAVPAGANTSGGARKTIGNTWELVGLPTGNYTVEYWAVDEAGNEERPRETASITVDGDPPTADAQIEQKPQILTVVGDTANQTQFNDVPIVPVDEPVTFTGSDSTDNSGSIGRYDWTFGDGTSDSGENVTHTYADTGYHRVNLTVDDGVGNEDRDGLTVYVAPSNETVLAKDQEHSVSTGTPFNVTIPTVVLQDAELSNLGVAPRTAGVGESVGVTADLTNRGSARATFVVGLFVDGQILARQQVSVGGGATEPVAFGHSFSATGTHQLSIVLLDGNGNVDSVLPPAEVTVGQGTATPTTGGTTPTPTRSPTATGGATETPEGTPTAPGFGVGVALLALALVAIRRRRYGP